MRHGHAAIRYLMLAILASLCVALLPRFWLGWRSNLVLLHMMPLLQTVQPLSATEFLPNSQSWLIRQPTSPEVITEQKIRSAVEAQLPAVLSLHTRATVYLLLGKPQAAKDALAETKDDPRSRLLLAFTYAQQGQFARVPDVLHRVPGAASMLVSAGMVEQVRGNYVEATQLLEIAEGIDHPEELDLSSLYRVLSFNSYYAFNDWDKAVGWSQRWVTVTNSDVNAVEWMSHLYLQRRQTEAAFEVWRRVDPVQASQSVSYWKDMGLIYQSRGNWDQAIAMYGAAWERDRDKPNGLRDYIGLYLGAALIHQGRVDEAQTYLEYVAQYGREDLRQAANKLLTSMIPK
ncbi:MAG: tetratricopeptide repeat protein [Nitrospirae bacterium]|nr:tetratricopeptide repeat protein [Nitrospirota bacterium]